MPWSLLCHESENNVFLNRVPGIIAIIITILAYPSSLSYATTAWFWAVSPCCPVCPTFCCPIVTDVLVTDFHITFWSVTKGGGTCTAFSFPHSNAIKTWSIAVWPLTPFLPFARTWLKNWVIVKQVFVELKVIINSQRITVTTMGECQNADMGL